MSVGMVVEKECAVCKGNVGVRLDVLGGREGSEPTSVASAFSRPFF
jgi:hypothetical protein